MEPFHKVLIWDKDGVPEPSDCFVVFWKDYAQNPSDQEFSIPTWIANNQNFVRNQYLDWVRRSYQRLKSNSELFNNLQLDSKINYFQLTPFVEMNLFTKSPQILSILKLIAFEAWSMDLVLISIDYVGNDVLLSKAFQGFAIKNQIPFNSNVTPQLDIKGIKRREHWIRFSISALKSLAWIFLKWIKTFPLHGLNVRSWKNNNAEITFYSYYAHFSPTNTSKSEFESDYWGELPKYLRSIGKHSNWIHLSPSNDGFLASLNKRRILKKWSIRRNSQSHLALESFFSTKILVRTILNWHKIRSIAEDIHKFLISQVASNFDFWPFYASEFERYLSGVGLMDNLLTLELVKSSVHSRRSAQQTFYLYEGQPWEKVLNSASANLNLKSPVAVQHSTVRFWDLRYLQYALEFSESFELEAYFPKTIIVNGNLSFQMLGERHPQEEIIKLESLRYKLSPLIARVSQEKVQRICPLILGSFLPEDDAFILRLMEETSENLADIEFTFKPHPLSVNSFSSDKVTVKESRQELRHLLQMATHVLISASTSAVIEVIESEIPFAIFLSPSIVNLSPLNQIVEMDFLNTSAQLLHFLTDSRNRDSEKLNVRDLVTPHGSLELWKRFIQKCKPDQV